MFGTVDGLFADCLIDMDRMMEEEEACTACEHECAGKGEQGAVKMLRNGRMSQGRRENGTSARN